MKSGSDSASNSDETSQPEKSLRLILHYRTPSLNQTKRQHWSQQYREKFRAFLALQEALKEAAAEELKALKSFDSQLCDLSAIECVHSIQTTSRDQLRIYSTAAAMLDSYVVMSRGGSGSKPSKSGLAALRKRKPKS